VGQGSGQVGMRDLQNSVTIVKLHGNQEKCDLTLGPAFIRIHNLLKLIFDLNPLNSIS
jgi:hypothetical protein